MSTSKHEAGSRPASTPILALAALGVVFGDIGTSPIYALREAAHAAAPGRLPTDSEIIGALSIIVWALTLIVAVKYAAIVLRADNDGEGGTLAIMGLARKAMARGRAASLLAVLGLFGAALFYGDAVLTPAISVLSAVEGLEVALPALHDQIIPITVVILIALFAFQRRGTASVSRLFGPITLLWFLLLGTSGSLHLADDPRVFQALNPLEAWRFAFEHRDIALVVFGAAFLAVTGAEALYVDLGHFGRKPILLAWFALVFPCLVLNYLGQGAFLLSHNEAASQPFFQMMPAQLQLAVVVLATLATVIASQAVISGAFSLTRQASQLGVLPRFMVRHTSADQQGQIYLPALNWMLLAGVLLLVLGFGSSNALAAAYGLSVSGEMIATTLLLGVVTRWLWCWSWLRSLLVLGPFLLLEALFLVANAVKVPDGGWVSLLIAGAVFAVMQAFVAGARLLRQHARRTDVPLPELIGALEAEPPPRVEGTAWFLTSTPDNAPTALLHSLKHYKVLHQQNVVLTIETASVPRVARTERISCEQLSAHFWRLRLRFGFMEDPNVPAALGCWRREPRYDAMRSSFFLSRRALYNQARGWSRLWRGLFVFLARNASDAAAYYRLPRERVIEIGTQIRL